MQRIRSVEAAQTLITQSTFAFLYISSEDCSVCKHLLPKAEEMLLQYPEIKSGYIEVNEVPGVAGAFSVFAAPVLILFVEGKEAIRESRYVNLEVLRDKIERYYQMLIQ